MFAHLEHVQHTHPHPAGTPWEAVVLAAVVLLVVAAAVGVVANRALLLKRLGGPSAPARGEVADHE